MFISSIEQSNLRNHSDITRLDLKMIIKIVCQNLSLLINSHSSF